MTIHDIKDLEKVMKLCQKHGVSSIKIDGIEFNIQPKHTAKHSRIDYDAFPEASIPVPKYSPVSVQDTANAVIEAIDMPDELSEDQMLYYSSKAEV